MSDRPGPADPPHLPGYTHRSLLGSGGFADVFVYEQDRTRRDVAVKVLRQRADGEHRAQILAEAEVMAQLSTHPYIVTVYDTDIAADGRPYLVMEYYSRPNLARRVRAGGLDVPEVLRIGIQVASAVETAHRGGIIHRDIKPANILTSDYGRPGLTDFGIASRSGRQDLHEGRMSIPWAAPEGFRDDVRPDQRSDIYSLGATLWNLLVGRSPFEIPDADNSAMVLWHRIENDAVPPTGRPDVPTSLERVLRQAMAKRPEHRFATALELARALQAVQQELHVATEAVALPDLGLTSTQSAPVAGAAGDQDAGVTIVRAPRRVEAQPPGRVIEAVPPAGPVAAPVPGAGPPPAAVPFDVGPGALPPRQGGAGGGGPALEATIHRSSIDRPEEPQPAAAATAAGSRTRWVIIAAALVLVVAGTSVVAALSRKDSGDSVAGDSVPVVPSAQDVLPPALPQPSGTATRTTPTTVRFVWSVADPAGVTGYMITRADPGSGPHPADDLVTATSFELAGVAATDRPCLDVRAADDSGATSAARRICVSR